jgi:hypothetical protein
MSTEQNIQQQIRLALSKTGSRMFRNNTAMAWTGSRVIRGRYGSMVLPEGSVLLLDARPLHAGLCVGSSDLIGWTPVTVTPDMVGQRLAVFTAIEVKTPKGKTSPEQTNFIDRVKIDGGIAGVARSANDATQITNQL